MKRFKVIADYPGSHLEIGKIINEYYGVRSYDEKNSFEKYPAIFEEIDWWQDLKEDDLKHLPEYIMIDPLIEIEPPFVVYKIIKWELVNGELKGTNYKKEEMGIGRLKLYLPSNKIEFAKYIREWKKYTNPDNW
jgi:hypothetical protein